MFKRIFDILIAVPALLLLSPAIILVAIAVRINLGSPVLFRQTRPGRNGKPFVIFKFRTMRDMLDGEGNQLPDGARLNALGRFLRRSSLDELPELWNVLKGDMSLVGPRPLLTEYLTRYTASQARRHEVKPGITGWAQVNGRNLVGWPERFALDVWYVDNHSVWLDIKILVLTIITVLRREGISEPNQATMTAFQPDPEIAENIEPDNR